MVALDTPKPLMGPIFLPRRSFNLLKFLIPATFIFFTTFYLMRDNQKLIYSPLGVTALAPEAETAIVQPDYTPAQPPPPSSPPPKLEYTEKPKSTEEEDKGHPNTPAGHGGKTSTQFEKPVAAVAIGSDQQKAKGNPVEEHEKQIQEHERQKEEHEKQIAKEKAQVAKSKFIKDFMENEIDGPFNLKPLRDFCASRTYVPGLIFRCIPPDGGVTNVKNGMLDCLRFALEGGASGWVLPDLMARGPDLLDLWTDDNKPFSWLFDHDHFMTSFREACPQIHVYTSDADLNIETANPLPPDNTPLEQSQQHQGVLKAPDLPGLEHTVENAPQIVSNMPQWNESFWNWVHEWAPPFSAEKPLVVTIHHSLLRIPVDYDPPAFAATFGRLIRFPENVRRVAAGVLYAMDQKFNLGLDFSKPGIQAGKFYGAHLRTSSDAVRVGWPGYDVQAPQYLDGIRSHNLSVVYLASGSQEDSERFRNTAKELGAEVVMKRELLEDHPGFEEELHLMKDATWDQWGLVDYEVLLRASQLGGMFETSFGWSAALKRHIVNGNGSWVPITPENAVAGLDPSSPACFQDRFSTIYGPRDMAGLRWNFPLSLWP